MQITIVTIGSQGDVQPFIALGNRLVQRGHKVKIATLKHFREYVLTKGFEYAPIAGDAKLVIKYLIGEDVKPHQYFKGLNTLIDPIKEQFLKDIWNACEGSDAVIYSVLGSVAYHAAEKMNIPCFRTFFCPLDPTGEFPTMTAPLLPFGEQYNKLTYYVGDLLWNNFTRKQLNSWRVDMGLQRIKPFTFPYRELKGKKVNTLYAFSPNIVSKPSGWEEYHHITGYWFLDEDKNWQPDDDLLEFLNRGRKPIYIGFGSMVGGSFKSALEIVLESLKKTEQRAILSSGWGELTNADLPDYVYKVGFIPHNWLFERVSAVIHHGGAGTTAAGLRAGVPTIVIPFGGDQPFWGKRIYELGVGPKPIPRMKLNGDNLGEAISKVVNDLDMIKKAAEIGKAIKDEDGVGKAVEVIERQLASLGSWTS